MSEPINTGGPAFPVGNEFGLEGMTLRDYFAAAAMHGWLASYGGQSEHPASSGNDAKLARLSYELADAMIAERSKTV